MGSNVLKVQRRRFLPQLLFVLLCLFTLSGNNRCQEDYILLKSSPSPSPTATPDDDDDDDDDDDLLTPTPTATPTETPTGTPSPTATATPSPTPTVSAFRSLVGTGQDLRSSLANADGEKGAEAGETNDNGSNAQGGRPRTARGIRTGSKGSGGSSGNWLGNLYTDKEQQGDDEGGDEDELPDDLSAYCEYLALKRAGQQIPKSRPDLLEMEVDSALLGFEPSDCE